MPAAATDPRFEALQQVPLAPRQRHRIGSAWLSRMKQEHLAVGTFALLSFELAAEGADPVVLDLLTRAANDEVRHAELCRGMATVWLKEKVPATLKGVPRPPRHPGRSGRERALLHLVQMCCLNETFTGVYFTEMLRRATHPAARSIVQGLLTDEIDHGRVGWAHLGAACREGWGAAVVSEALPGLLERTVGPVMAQAARAPEPDDPELEALGFLGTTAGAELYRSALQEVVLPGFEATGVDCAAVGERCHQRGWLAG